MIERYGRRERQKLTFIILVIDVEHPHQRNRYRHHHSHRQHHRYYGEYCHKNPKYHPTRVVFLAPGETIVSTVNSNVGHTVSMTLLFLDQNGNPMLATPAPDAPPVWTQTTPATDTLTAAASGLTAQSVALVVGTDEVDVDLKVGGVDFKALIDLNVQAAPQVLTSVQIAATVA